MSNCTAVIALILLVHSLVSATFFLPHKLGSQSTAETRLFFNNAFTDIGQMKYCIRYNKKWLQWLQGAGNEWEGKYQKNCQLPSTASLIASTYWAGTQYTQ